MFTKIFLLLFLFTYNVALQSQEFNFGVDQSYVNEMEDCGAAYKVNGVETDPYKIFEERGANLVRLRLWHTPSWYDELNDGVRYSDFNDVRLSIMRAKAEGMDVLLDFHLSDTWADPSHQVIPAAWLPVVDNLPALQDSVYNYIYSTLGKLATEGLLPEIVQIGNETNKGILLTQEVNDAGWTLDWDRNSSLFNSAISAVHDIEALHMKVVKIAIHIADPDAVEWYISQFESHGVNDYDIIGISYYSQWHSVTIEAVGLVVAQLKIEYPDKEVMILETAYPWTSSNADGANNLLSVTYPGYATFSPTNQKEWMIDFTQEMIDNGASGIVFWEPGWVSTGCSTLWVQGSSWDNVAFFNFNHELIENGGIDWMMYMYNVTGIENNSGYKFSPVTLQFYGGKVIVEMDSEKVYAGNFELRISSVDGKDIYSKDALSFMDDARLEFQVPSWSAGVYVTTLLIDGRVTFSDKFVLSD